MNVSFNIFRLEQGSGTSEFNQLTNDLSMEGSDAAGDENVSRSFHFSLLIYSLLLLTVYNVHFVFFLLTGERKIEH